jgi:hypothetical protein
LRRFRYEYGAGPLHLAAVAVCFGVTSYAISQMLGRGILWVALWVLAAALLHDLVLFPLYASSDRVAGLLARLARSSTRTPRPVSALNYVRFVVVFAGLQGLVWLPLILGLGGLARVSGQPQEGYLERWLGLSLAVALVAGLVYTVRWRRLASRAGGSSA